MLNLEARQLLGPSEQKSQNQGDGQRYPHHLPHYIETTGRPFLIGSISTKVESVVFSPNDWMSRLKVGHKYRAAVS